MQYVHDQVVVLPFQRGFLSLMASMSKVSAMAFVFQTVLKDLGVVRMEI